MPGDLSDVAVVTVTYQSADELAGFVDSVRDSETESVPIVIADNPSEESDRVVEIAGRRGIRVIAMTENVGYGAAVNAAVREIGPAIRWVLVSNPDVRLHPGAISTLLHLLRAEPEIGAAGPLVLNEDGSTYPSARQIPSLRTGVGHALFSGVWPGNPWTSRYRNDRTPMDRRQRVGWLSGSCLLVRRDAFDEIGGFDERYFMYFEDVDLGYRLDRAGWSNVFEPGAVVTHTGGRSTSTVRSSMLRAHHRSAQHFLDRKYSAWYVAPVRWAVHLGLDVRAWWLTRGMRG